MFYKLHIHEATLLVTDSHRGSFTSAFGKRQLEKTLGALSYTQTSDLDFSSVTLRYIVRKFSEQNIGDIEVELGAQFKKQNGMALNVHYPDLLYFATISGPQFNKSVSGAIGEGIAGYVVQKLYGFVPKSRPIGYSPDIIMGKDQPYSIALVEAKGTSKSDVKGIRTTIRDAAVELLQMLSAAPYLKAAKYAGYVVGTEITENEEFNCYVLRLEQ